MVIKTRGAAAVPEPKRPVAKSKLEKLGKVVGKISPAKVDAGDDGKQAISIRLDAEIIEFFKAAGPGWQTRINRALRSYCGLGKGVEKSGAEG